MHLISGLSRCLLPSPACSSPHFPADANRHRQQHSRHSRCSLPKLTMKVNKFRHSKPPAGSAKSSTTSVPGASETAVKRSSTKQNFRFISGGVHTQQQQPQTQITPGSTGERQEAKERKKKYHANPTEKSYTSTSIYIHRPVPDT